MLPAMSKAEPTVTCPTCGAPAVWSRENRYRPFCSERCRLIDLGEWLKEERRIPGEPVGFDEGMGEYPPDGDDRLG